MASFRQISTFLSCFIFIQLLVVVVLHLTPNTFAQPEFLYYNCTYTANYTNPSTYNTNLNTTLSSLSSNIDQYGYYNSSIGQEPDRVTAVALCRGDVELKLFCACINDSISKLKQVCPAQKEAIAWYDNCMLRYTNQIIPFGTMVWGPGFDKRNDKLFVPDEYMDAFQELRRTLLVSLRDKAASGDARRKYATGDEQLQNYETVYSLVQCTPDLSESGCKECINACMERIPICCNQSKGGAVYKPTCNLRYELGIGAFYNELSPSPSPQAQPQPPPAPPPSEDNTTRNVIIIVFSIAIFVMLVFFILICLIKKRKQRNASEPLDRLIENADGISTSATWNLLNRVIGRAMDLQKNIRPGPTRTDNTGPARLYTPNFGNPTSPATPKAPRRIRLQRKLILVPLQYDFSTIRLATDNFSDTNKCGQGGFGPVYKGILPNGKEIAVKRLSKESGQGEVEFKNEVLLMARLLHRNLVRLLGFSLQGTERLLVYEFVVNGSLDHFIFDTIKGATLDWEKRYKIIGGIAKGLVYLHEDSPRRIIHRDLKASNILLDAEMNAKIADFGMARCFVLDETQGSTTKIAGTYGYMAPEVLQGHISVKSDVYSFGVLVLETISGQKISKTFVVEENAESLLSYAWKMWWEGTANRIAAPNLIEPTMRNNSGSIHDIMRCVHIGLLCVQENVAKRPTMAAVVLMLSSLSMTLPVPTKPAFFLNSSSSSSSSSTLKMEMPLPEQAHKSSINEAS